MKAEGTSAVHNSMAVLFTSLGQGLLDVFDHRLGEIWRKACATFIVCQTTSFSSEDSEILYKSSQDTYRTVAKKGKKPGCLLK
jgi:hypothetical protein